MKLQSFGELADLLESRLASTVASLPAALEAGAELVKAAAQRRIGTYQGAAGDLPAWAPLASATQADRVRKGFSADEPLLRTGELRDSIEVRPVAEGGVLVGVFDAEMLPIACAQEFGAVNPRTGGVIPPRSFIRGAAFESTEAVGKVISRAFVAGMEGEARE